MKGTHYHRQHTSRGADDQTNQTQFRDITVYKEAIRLQHGLQGSAAWYKRHLRWVCHLRQRQLEMVSPHLHDRTSRKLTRQWQLQDNLFLDYISGGIFFDCCGAVIFAVCDNFLSIITSERHGTSWLVNREDCTTGYPFTSLCMSFLDEELD